MKLKPSEYGTEYILLKKCFNCASLNNKANNGCTFCGKLFIGEISYDEMFKRDQELKNKAVEVDENNL